MCNNQQESETLRNQAALVDIVGLLFKARLVRLELVLKVANGLSQCIHVLWTSA